MSKIQKLRSTFGLITYLPELIAGFLGGVLTLLYLGLRNLALLFPEICRTIGKVFLTSFKALIIALGIVAVINFLVGGVANYPIFIATALVNGTYHTLPTLVSYGFSAIFAASLANFKLQWLIVDEADAANGHDGIIPGLIRFWAPVLYICLEVLKVVLLQDDLLLTKENLHKSFNNLKVKFRQTYEQVKDGAKQSAAFVTSLKHGTHEAVSDSEVVKTVNRKLTAAYEFMILRPGRWLGLVKQVDVNENNDELTSEEETDHAEHDEDVADKEKDLLSSKSKGYFPSGSIDANVEDGLLNDIKLTGNQKNGRSESLHSRTPSPHQQLNAS